jgi:hypothetical protein
MFLKAYLTKYICCLWTTDSTTRFPALQSQNKLPSWTWISNSYATESFCQTARESARVSPPPGLTPYWDINRAEASAIQVPSLPLARAPISSGCLHTRYLLAQFQFLRGIGLVFQRGRFDSHRGQAWEMSRYKIAICECWIASRGKNFDR